MPRNLRPDIERALEEADRPLSTVEIAKRIGSGTRSVNRHLRVLRRLEQVKADRVVRPTGGWQFLYRPLPKAQAPPVFASDPWWQDIALAMVEAEKDRRRKRAMTERREEETHG